MEWIWLLSPFLSDTFPPTTTTNQHRYNMIHVYSNKVIRAFLKCHPRIILSVRKGASHRILKPTHNKTKLNQHTAHGPIWNVREVVSPAADLRRLRQAEECGVWASHHNSAPPPLSPLNSTPLSSSFTSSTPVAMELQHEHKIIMSLATTSK